MIDKEANISELPENRFHRSIWLLFEYPHSSIFARLIAVISVVVVVVSITLFCAETLPEVKARRTPAPTLVVTADEKNRSSSQGVASAYLSRTPVKDEFFVIESICIFWFSIELIMRFYSAPNRMKFVKEFGNLVDFFSILPYFMEITDTSARFSILRIIRLVRVFRIFKLARHFKGLQILAHTLKASLNELATLMFFLIIGVVLFSSIVYFLELDDARSDFHSIPDGFWYAIIVSIWFQKFNLRLLSEL